MSHSFIKSIDNVLHFDREVGDGSDGNLVGYTEARLGERADYRTDRISVAAI